MASSSSSTPSSQPPKKHHVFISFRGEDTRRNFISHLYEALCSKQIKTFIDYHLEKGDEVWPSLEDAIEDSTLFLVIFSKKYASSTWCVKELAKILEYSKNQGNLVIPVFYRVDPSDVRKQSRSYQKAFEEHKLKRINEQQLQKWREALTHAANLSGFDYNNYRNEAELISKIIRCVVQKLEHNYQSDDDLKDLIGIRERMADVKSLLYKGSNDDVRFIGIWGMGGTGKTTLAEALFSKLRFAYEGFCFLTNVRDKSKKIYALKKKLILKLLGDKKSQINKVDDAISLYDMTRLKRKKVFIVLDDIDDHKQLEKLAGRHDWFGPGSRILITTRDKQVFKKEVDDIYELEALNSYEAFQLFSLNAFKEGNGGDPKIRELAKTLAQYAEGNPLALAVLGSLLCGKNQEVWKSQLKKLQKLPHPKVNDILKLSFEGLDDEEKNIFLHITCFFNHDDVEDVKNLLGKYYSIEIGLERLVDKALINTHGGTICMHHLIKQMGQQIVHEKSYPKMPVRIWNSNEIFEISKKDTGSIYIEGIILVASEVLEETSLSPQIFRSMPNLRFLIFHKDFNENNLKFPGGIEFLPNKLILLCWEGYPSKSLPATFTGEDLVEIRMRYRKLTKLWDGVQNLVNLRKIDLCGSEDLIELPNFSKAIQLVDVDLNYCSKLQSVHPSILSLHSLRRLLLRDCEGLTSLTSNTYLKSLDSLDLYGCSRLYKFSVTSENPLFDLFLSDTAINGELCSSSGQLSIIGSLHLDGCKSVTSIHNLVDLRTLEDLDADGCNKLASNLHPIFDEARALQVLSLEGCSELFEVPDNISLLSSLRQLNLSGSNIETLPSSIGHLSSLQYLYLADCKKLRLLPKLPPSISVLSAENCKSLETLYLSHIHNYDVSYYIRIRNCMKLDPLSIQVVLAEVIYNGGSMEYPGERVPEWLEYRAPQPSLTVDLHSIDQQRWDGRFIFFVVVSESSPFGSLTVSLLIDGQDAGLYESVPLGVYSSDHVFFGCYSNSSRGLQRIIEENKRHAQSNTYYPLVEVQLISPISNSWSKEEYDGYIKECGVCLTYADKYENYIQQIQLAMEASS